MSRLSPGARAQAGIVLVLVAIAGALLGILGDRLVAQQRVGAEVTAPAPRTMPEFRPGGGRMRYGDRLALRLDLSASQRAQIDTILAEEQLRIRELSRQFQPRFRAIAEQTRSRVEAVLTPEQRDELRSLRAERMRRIGDRPMFHDSMRPMRRRP